MLGLSAQADRVFACVDEITQGFVSGRRNLDGGELPRDVNRANASPTRRWVFDPIAAPLRHARGIDDDAVLSLTGEIAVDPKPARAGIIHEAQPPVRCSQCPQDLGHRPPGRRPSPLRGALRRLVRPPRARRRPIPCGHPSRRTCYVLSWPAVVCGSAGHPHRRRVIHDLLHRQASAPTAILSRPPT